MQEASASLIIYTKEGSEDETVHVIWGSVPCISHTYGAACRNDMGYSILLYRNGNKLYIRTLMEGDETHAVMENRRYSH